MEQQQEHFFTCPYCFEEISMILDLSVESQSFIEDCEVCCNPIQLSFGIEEEAITTFSAVRIQ